MKEYLKRYSDENPERFNRDFIMSRKDTDILEYIKDIFKSLEVLGNFEVLDVHMETDESQFKPIIKNDRYYKPIERSRLNRVVYTIKIIPSYTNPLNTILPDEDEPSFNPEKNYQLISKRDVKEEEAPVILTKEIFMNKLIDDCFYYNEGIRYFLIYQIVDNATYGNRDSVSLKSLHMPISVNRFYIKNPLTPVWPDYASFSKEELAVLENDDTLPIFRSLLFKKRINPLLYVFGKYSYNSLITMDYTGKDPENIIIERQKYRDPEIPNRINRFFGTDIKFSDNLESLKAPNRLIYQIETKGAKGCYLSVDKAKLLARDQNLIAILGSLLNMSSRDSKDFIYTYDNLITPWFWIEKLSSFFTPNSDPVRKFEKTQTMLISLARLMDDATRRVLALEDDAKKDTLTIIRYIMRNFETLAKADNQDLESKRIRLFEYQLYPLRTYFSSQIYRIINSSTRTREVLLRVFANLKPMYIIKKTVTNELLRYYNSSNDFNLFSAFLKCTFRGPQSLNKSVSILQRDLHPSYVGRLSLIASSASDPGMSSTFTPFIKVYDGGYFKDQKIK